MALFMCVLRTNLLPSQACSKMVFNHSIKNQALHKNLEQLKRKKSCSCSSVFMEPPAPHWLNPTSFSFLLLKGKMNVWGIGWCYQHNKGVFKLVFSLTEGDQQSFWVSFSWAKTRKKWPYFLYQTAGLLQRRREPRQGDNPCWFYRKCLFWQMTDTFLAADLQRFVQKNTLKSQTRKTDSLYFCRAFCRPLRTKCRRLNKRTPLRLCCGFVAPGHISNPTTWAAVVVWPQSGHSHSHESCCGSFACSHHYRRKPELG